MMSNVPQIQWTQNGPVVPTQAQILNGVQLDMNAAFGGNLNAQLSTPQGQLATSYTAMISACYGALVFLSNNFDPAYASGRFQDAIGRYYNLSRLPPVSTVIQVQCFGLTGVDIPVGSQVVDISGNIYSSTLDGVIPAGGSITLPFANIVTGAIAVPTSVAIQTALTGWDSVTLVGGAIGNPVENQYAFETRRQQTLMQNSNNQNQSILGAVLSVPNVVSAYVQDNTNNYPLAVAPVATTTGYIAGTLLYLTSSAGVAIGQAVSGFGVMNGTVITGGSTSPWTINNSQTVGAAGSLYTMNLGGVPINANSVYVCVLGGLSASIAQAIWSKKAPGCGTTGSTAQTVYDTSSIYGSPGIPYTINYQIPTSCPIFFAVSLKSNLYIPANALQLIQTAIQNAFIGADGGLPAQIGQQLLSSRYSAGITALGSWAQLISVQFKSSLTTTPDTVFTGSITGTTLTITAVASGSGLTPVVGLALVGANITPGTVIQIQLSGTAGIIAGATYQVSLNQTAASASVNGFEVNNYQQKININQMPTCPPNYVTLTLV